MSYFVCIFKAGKLICRDEKGNTNKFIPLLEAMVGDKLVRVKLSPDPSLEAIVNGEQIDCHIIVGQGNALEGEKKLWNNRRTKPGRLVASGNNKHVTWDPHLLSRESGGCINPKANRRTKRKKCSSPVHIAKNSATAKLEKLIGSALRQYDDAKAQELACIALRKLIVSKEAANTIVYLGGINMVATAMLNHTVRPITQAEALATLAEMTWANPSLGTDTIKGGCLSLTLATMGRHEVHFNVQQMAIGYFRALSYDSKCCRLMTKSNVVDIVVRSMRRNPKKLDVLREGR